MALEQCLRSVMEDARVATAVTLFTVRSLNPFCPQIENQCGLDMTKEIIVCLRR